MSARSVLLLMNFMFLLLPRSSHDIHHLKLESASSISLGEAVDNTELTWTTSGDSLWFGQTIVTYAGGDAAQSGEVSAGQFSRLETVIDGPGILTFYWRVSTATAVTNLTLVMDGVIKDRCWAYEYWDRRAIVIPAGRHTLQWNFAPFIPGYAGYLDAVTYTPGPAIQLTLPTTGASWSQRQFGSIQWLATSNSGPSVRLELYQQGEWVDTIAPSTENDGFYSWLVPSNLEPDDEYQIKVIAAHDPSIVGQSGDFEVIASPQSNLRAALVFDGVDDQAITPPHAQLDVGHGPGQSFTIDAWFNLRGNSLQPLDRRWIVLKPESYGFYVTRHLDLATLNYFGCLGFRWQTPSGNEEERSHCQAPAFALNWHHAAVVYDAGQGQARFFLDGQPFGDPFSLPVSLAESNEPLTVGENMAGALDEIRLSDGSRVIGDSIPISTSPLPCDPLTRALWHFDELPVASVFHDACGHDNALSARNGVHTEGLLVDLGYVPMVAR